MQKEVRILTNEEIHKLKTKKQNWNKLQSEYIDDDEEQLFGKKFMPSHKNQEIELSENESQENRNQNNQALNKNDNEDFEMEQSQQDE